MLTRAGQAIAKTVVVWRTTGSPASRLRRGQYRTLLSKISCPPLDSAVPERPCTMVVAESLLYPTSSSWNSAFKSRAPQDHGISTGAFSWSDSVTNWKAALDELKSDLSAHHDVVFIARGPLQCWIAQLYLESHPLAGLILVDPLPLDDRNGINQFELYYEKHSFKQSKEYHIFRRILDDTTMSAPIPHALQLEAGAVPMMVWHSIPRPAFKRAADSTAQRHSNSNGPFGIVPVLQLHLPLVKSTPNVLGINSLENAKGGLEMDKYAREAVDIACSWTIDQVL
jgi:hypothetical protein